MEEKQSILLCEDDENLGMLLREYLQAKGYNAELCADGDAGYKAFLKGKFDIGTRGGGHGTGGGACVPTTCQADAFVIVRNIHGEISFHEQNQS